MRILEPTAEQQPGVDRRHLVLPVQEEIVRWTWWSCLVRGDTAVVSLRSRASGDRAVNRRCCQRTPSHL